MKTRIYAAPAVIGLMVIIVLPTILRFKQRDIKNIICQVKVQKCFIVLHYTQFILRNCIQNMPCDAYVRREEFVKICSSSKIGTFILLVPERVYNTDHKPLKSIYNLSNINI